MIAQSTAISHVAEETRHMGKNSTTRYRGEDGTFMTEKEAKSLPKSEYTKEQVPKPGRGDTGRGKGK